MAKPVIIVWKKLARMIPLSWAAWVNIVMVIYILITMSWYTTMFIKNGSFSIITSLNLTINIPFYAWVIWKYNDLVKRRHEPGVGLKLIDTNTILNFKWVGLGIISRYESFMIIFTGFGLMTIILNVLSWDITSIPAILQSLYAVVFLFPAFNLLEVDRPKTTVWQDIKATIKARREQAQHKFVPIPIRI